MRSLKDFARSKSFHVIYLNTGSCNGCDIEILASLSPRYDIEQYGIFAHQPNPREADVILVTGPVAEQWEEKLVSLYRKVPEPKVVVAIGQCSCSGALFEDGETDPPVSDYIPVDAKIPGCPPRPQEIVDTLLQVAPRVFKGYGEE
ncbi:hypothetical protein AKJ50_02160 [candidate division MSBL1 archaeon SCGC-AAA382A13]|uniref:NADH:ubiquinone oxidoreductase-like 20kDa subunit domain-containing protein n=1 Tax=candidate division MSBL1 archaeon SCGC-AAA382A13 TaxID=1698279 RepID=A0A133VDY0_9EURY|nr:hypothetical protein AKJ50_02160 [candidate division MSBL1 archaeon SCGC-AAA382A13]